MWLKVHLCSYPALSESVLQVFLIGYEQMSPFQTQRKRKREREHICRGSVDSLIRMSSWQPGTLQTGATNKHGNRSFLNCPQMSSPPPAVFIVLISQCYCTEISNLWCVVCRRGMPSVKGTRKNSGNSKICFRKFKSHGVKLCTRLQWNLLSCSLVDCRNYKNENV